MAAPRSALQREKDRAFVAEKYLMQWTQAEIANALSIDVSTVSRDLQAIQKQWRESAMTIIQEAKERELARLDTLEREYWSAWEKSKLPSKAITKRNFRVGEEEHMHTTQTAEERVGDPRFLAGIHSCIERRCKILGIDAPMQGRIEIDWRGRAIEDIRRGVVTFEQLAREDVNLAQELFREAGINVDES